MLLKERGGGMLRKTTGLGREAGGRGNKQRVGGGSGGSGTGERLNKYQVLMWIPW